MTYLNDVTHMSRNWTWSLLKLHISENHQRNTSSDFEPRDTAVVETGVRFQQSGMEQYMKLETNLISEEESKVVDSYPEIDSDSLKIQVPLFRKPRTFSTPEQAATELRSLTPEISAKH
ncbi:hypothetical protein PR048_018332 [Dryococelus australis]|uniref:Uncharacterized protein n=1 Tax=Dryococelus australis TaxID=614101 RepID=A0ABQ9HC35_9NEOP|nr:hypothetical protein PR048_018332 [Dryococelus australis]